MKAFPNLSIFSMLTVALFNTNVLAHGDDPNVTIHTFKNGETWKNCSFMVDPSLTQTEFHRFTREAGNIVYFQPLTGASSLGKKHFNLGIAMSNTPIDQTSGAWNNTFAHPVTETGERPHYLGDKIKLPNLRLAAGITDQIDIGMFVTRDFSANYGFYGLDLKYSQKIQENKSVYLAGRISHARMFGPADLKLNNTAIDLIISKKWHILEPYFGISTSWSHASETTNKVNLKNENIITPRAIVGLKTEYKWLNAAVEYDFSAVQTLSFRLGAKI
ncbi:MAG: hypothetical protein KG003_08345 [Bacteroidetes bacterium]|nr:hypothetical protein [Bacteroidota bacterium]